MSLRTRRGTVKRVSYHRRLGIETLEDRRLLVAGVIDPSFDTDGKVTTNKIFDTTDRNEEARSVAIQTTGKIVVGGFTANSSGNNDFALTRYSSNGALDVTFGAAATGKVSTPIGSSDDEIYSIALQSDDKIIVVGRTRNSGGNYDIVVALHGRRLAGHDVQFDRQADDESEHTQRRSIRGGAALDGHHRCGGTFAGRWVELRFLFDSSIVDWNGARYDVYGNVYWLYGSG